MQLEQKIDILKNTFNMDMNKIEIIMPKIDMLEFSSIIDILYCYINKSDIVFNIFNKYSQKDLIIISLLINLNTLTYTQCLELFNMNGLKIRTILSVIYNITSIEIFISNNIYNIFEILKNMNDTILMKFYKLRRKLIGSINLIDAIRACELLNDSQIDNFIITFNKIYYNSINRVII